MECYLHILTISGKKEPRLLCIFVILLQRDHYPLSLLCMWMPEQEELCQVKSDFQNN